MPNYSKHIMEPYAIDVLSSTLDNKYNSYKNFSENGFDYESNDRKNVLEITMAMTKQEKELTEYEKAYQEKGFADTSRVSHKIYYDGKFVGVQGTINDIIKTIIYSIKNKELKRKKREKNKIKNYELCILVTQVMLLDINNLSIIKDYMYGFNNIFIVTRDYLFVINSKTISKYNKKFNNKYKL